MPTFPLFKSFARAGDDFRQVASCAVTSFVAAQSLSRFHLQQFLARLRLSAFVRNMLAVMTGTVAAQVISFALFPFISRLFSPSDFGVFGSFVAVSGVIASGATLEYPQAVMLPKGKKDAINLFVVSCLSTLVVGALCLLGCLLAPAAVHRLMNSSGVWILGLLVASTVTSGLNQACQAWSVRAKAFKQTSTSQVVRSLSSSGTQIGLGYLSAGPAGLIIGSVLAEVLATLALLRVLLPDLKALRGSIRWVRMRQLAQEYQDFPLYSASSRVMNELAQGLPVLLLAHFYGIAVAGAFAFGTRMLLSAMNFVLGALRQVLFQKACETHNQGGRLLPLYLKITAGLFGLAAIPSLVLLLWAPQIFGWVFGAEWHASGEFARSLVLSMLFGFCNVPSVLFARILRLQRKLFVFQFVQLAGRSLALFLGGFYLSAQHTVLLFSVVGTIMNAVLIGMVGCALLKREGGPVSSRVLLPVNLD